LVDRDQVLREGIRCSETAAGTARIAAAQRARWEWFRQQHGHDRKPLLDARSPVSGAMECLYAIAGRTADSGGACYSPYSCNTREGTPVCWSRFATITSIKRLRL